MVLGLSDSRKPKRLVIAFTDFSHFRKQTQRVSDAELADTMDDFYQLVSRVVGQARGRIVKFIGDSALIVYPGDNPDAAVRNLLALRTESDQFMVARDWECRFSAKAHVGDVVAGDFGPKGDRRFDVMGREVNATAMLGAPAAGAGIVLSDTLRAVVSAELAAKTQNV